MRHILSFDVAKGKSVYCFIDENKNTIINATSIEHTKNDFDFLLKEINKYENVTVVMESTSIYHIPVENYFRSNDINTIVINPKLVKQFKDTLNKSKTDKLDCFKIARCYLGTIDSFYYKKVILSAHWVLVTALYEHALQRITIHLTPSSTRNCVRFYPFSIHLASFKSCIVC